MLGCFQTAINTKTLPFLKHILTKSEFTLQVDFFRETYVPFSGGNRQRKDRVTVPPPIIHYKGVNGEVEIQEPRGAVR